MQEETQQEGIYHQTIKKQEIVIAKLENLLEKSVNQRFKNEKNGEELQALNSDIATLQSQVRKVSYGPNN
jgi:SOS-response transcriptional repressor LexA